MTLEIQAKKIPEIQAASMPLQKRPSTLEIKSRGFVNSSLPLSTEHCNASFIKDDCVQLDRTVFASLVDEVAEYRSMLTMLQNVLEMVRESSHSVYLLYEIVDIMIVRGNLLFWYYISKIFFILNFLKFVSPKLEHWFTSSS